MEVERVREIDLHLTNRCNLTCAHCSVDSGPGRSNWNEMSVSDWTEVVSDAASIGCRYIDLTGGEPVLYHGVENIIQTVVSNGINLELQSNGILLTLETLNRLREVGLSTLVISLDGDEDQHDLIRGRIGVYRRAIQAIRDAVALGFGVRVTRVISDPEDVTSIRTFLLNLEELGVNHLSLNLFSPVTPGHFCFYRKPDPASWFAFVEALEKNAGHVSYPITYEVAYARPEDISEFLSEETRCLIQRRRWFLIRSDGEVFPCYHFVHRSEMSVGNVRQTSLSKLIDAGRWNSYAAVNEVPTECKDCSFASRCGGGCPSPGYLQLGRLDIKDIRCEVDRGYLPVCPFIKRRAGDRRMTNIAPYYE